MSVKKNTKQKPIATTCPHCGFKVAFPILTNVVHAEYEDDISTDLSGVVAYCKDEVYLSICVNCDHPVLVGNVWNNLSEDHNIYTYPRHMKKATNELPDQIRYALNDIYKCQSVWAHSATAVMCRRLIEQCCRHFGFEKRPLSKQIDRLLTEEFPNESLRQQAHLIRYIGNEGAHALEEVRYDEAEALVAFCEEFAHHIFITKKKFEEMVKRLENRKDGKKKND